MPPMVTGEANMNTQASGADTAEILARIESLQAIQKRNRPTSAEWIEASNELKPLFEEMARRSK